jgi:hypothetical protein
MMIDAGDNARHAYNPSDRGREVGKLLYPKPALDLTELGVGRPRGVDQDRPTVGCRSGAVLDVLNAVGDQARPRLTDAEYLHRMLVRRRRSAA